MTLALTETVQPPSSRTAGRVRGGTGHGPGFAPIRCCRRSAHLTAAGPSVWFSDSAPSLHIRMAQGSGGSFQKTSAALCRATP